MGDARRSAGLRTIFSFFLGLMLAVFIGLGVYTFYPQPHPNESAIEGLENREKEIRDSRPATELTIEEREQIQEIQRQRSELVEGETAAWRPWGTRTSIILIVFSTLALAVSLIRADQLPVISNGLLLGGVFTMLYGVGWIVATDTSVTRFLVMTVALVITVGLGYVRFVRRGSTAPSADGPGIAMGEGLADIERRVGELEGRLDALAQALGPRGD